MAIAMQQQPKFNRQQYDEIVGRIFGNTPTNYFGQFKEAYNLLGQGSDVNPGNVAYTATHDLARSFIDSYAKKFGRLPTDEETGNFVDQNLTAGNAAKFIKGTYTQGSQNQDAASFIEDLQQSQPQQGAGGQQMDPSAMAELDRLFGAQEAGAVDKVNRTFGEQKATQANDLAALGILRSPSGASQLGRVDDQKSSALSQLFGDMATNRAGSFLDAYKFDKGQGQQESQFGRSLGLQKRQLAAGTDESMMNRIFQGQEGEKNRWQQREIAGAGPKRDWMDYAGLGIGALSLFKPTK